MSTAKLQQKIKKALAQPYCGYMPGEETQYCGQNYCAMGQNFASTVKRMSPNSRSKSVREKAYSLSKSKNPEQLYGFLDGYAKGHMEDDSDDSSSDSESSSSDPRPRNYSHRRPKEDIDDAELVAGIESFLAKNNRSSSSTISDAALVKKIDEHLYATSRKYKGASPKQKQSYIHKVLFGDRS